MTKFRQLFLSVLVLFGGSVFTVSPAWSVAPPSPAQPVPDVSLPDTVQLSPSQMGAHWVKTEVVRTRKLIRTINRTGSLNFDEEMVSVLAARVSGREVKILAFEGQKVRRNDALALVYSPDFVTAEVEYLNAFKVASTFQDKSETETYIRAAAKKLILLGASDRDLKTLSTTRKIFPYLTIHAPRSGVILNSQLREGLFMNPGDQLLTIADLSKLWVYMDIYEGDLPLVRTGQKIDVRTVAYPDRVFAGRIIYQGGMVDPATRTFHVRGEIDNPNHLLKPGMFASVVIRLTRPKPVVALPEASFLKDDKGYHVFIEVSKGVFRVRPVLVGPEEEGLLTVEGGVSPGETVVVSGSLLVEGLREQIQNHREQENRPKGTGGLK
ncbi:MAG: efflux RND transporter periplasmic adaptor subunit [Leptospirales bacterium]